MSAMPRVRQLGSANAAAQRASRSSRSQRITPVPTLAKARCSERDDTRCALRQGLDIQVWIGDALARVVLRSRHQCAPRVDRAIVERRAVRGQQVEQLVDQHGGLDVVDFGQRLVQALHETVQHAAEAAGRLQPLRQAPVEAACQRAHAAARRLDHGLPERLVELQAIGPRVVEQQHVARPQQGLCAGLLDARRCRCVAP